MKRILCIWLPNWPIARIIAARPELIDLCIVNARIKGVPPGNRASPSIIDYARGNENRPVVLHEIVRGTARVAACSARAEDLGISVGMPLAEATALTGRTRPHLEPYDRLADRTALAELAGCCDRFSPTVAVDQATTPDCLLLDISGVAHLFGGEAALAQLVIDEFTRRRLTVRLAIADTLGAAWAVVRSEVGGRKSDLVIVPAGGVAGALEALPVEGLRLPEETVGLLHQLGIYRIGQVEGLPREELSARFGPQLLTRLDQAFGRVEEVVSGGQPVGEFVAECSLEYPTARRKAIELTLERLIDRLSTMLRERGRGVLRLDCRLDWAGGAAPVSVGLFEPTVSTRHLFDLLQLETERLRLPSPVTAVRVEATATAPLEYRQGELFSGDAGRAGRRQLAGLVDRLSNRLGRRSVVRARLTSDAQPELAYRYSPLIGDSGESRLRRTGRRRKTLPPPRPLILFDRPIRLEATSISPNGPPLGFHLDGHRHQVTRHWGPERIETGWWRKRGVRRDYYRVETTAGRRFWLFRRLVDGGWFVHGIFE